MWRRPAVRWTISWFLGLVEVEEMAKRNFSTIAKMILMAAFTVALCLATGCEKAEEPQGPTPQEVKSEAADHGHDHAEGEEHPAAEVAAAVKETAETAVEEATEAVVAEVEEAAAAVAMAEMEIKLPKPMFVGTPQDTRVPNLRKPRGKARPPFLAPVGTTLLSLNKPVSASDEEPIIGDIEMITDGDKEAADGSYVELGPFVQHVTVDLEQECEIYVVIVWHYHKQPRVYFDVIAQISNDPDFITDVTTVFNNDIDNSAGLGIGKDMHYTETNEGELIDCLSKGSPKGRYVRLYSNGNTSNDLNHYIEIDVYGKPVE